MKKRFVTLIAGLLLAVPTSVFAEENSGKLSGTFGFYGDTCEANSKAKGCVISFELSGAAAKALYDRMPVKAVPEACTEGLLKDDGNGMRCYKAEGKYRCDFGYSFSKRKITGSDVSC
jgi:hypothetical protein